MNATQTDLDHKHLILCFNIHQPKRLAASEDGALLDENNDRVIMERIARDCYIPMNHLLLRLIGQYPQIKINFSISGIALEQLEKYAPEVLVLFRKLADTGSVDFLAEPYYHGLSFLFDSDEFEIQILQHAEKLIEHFGVRPTVFRNTHLIYNDEIGKRIHRMGYQGVITEFSSKAFEGKRPHQIYESVEQGLYIMTRARNLSDDIAFRSGTQSHHVTADQILTRLDAIHQGENLVLIGVDYETFGEHRKTETGIFTFIEHLLLMIAIQKTYTMATAAEIVTKFCAFETVSIPDLISMSGSPIEALLQSPNQRTAFQALVALEKPIKESGDPEMLELWRVLQSCDHFYHLSPQADGHGTFSPYPSSDEAFKRYMNAVHYLQQHVEPRAEVSPEKQNEQSEVERRTLSTPLWARSKSRAGHS